MQEVQNHQRQTFNTGKSNLESHLCARVGLDCMDEFNEFTAANMSSERITSHLENLVNEKDQFTFEWIEWVVMNGPPLSMANDPLTRGIGRLIPASRETLRKRILHCHKSMMEDVKALLKVKKIV